MVNYSRLCTTIACAWLFFSQPSLADINAELSASKVQEGDTVVLTLSDTDNSGGQPNLAPLDTDFNVLGTQSSQRTSIVNGRRSSLTQWLVTLYPKRVGSLQIPALSQGTHRTRPLTLNVTEAPVNQVVPTADSPVVQAELDRPTVYLGGQVLMTVRIMHLGNVADYNLAEVKLPNTTAVAVADRNYQRMINNRPVAVFEHTFALHPEAAGELEIPGMLLKAEIATGNQRSIFGSLQTKTVLRKGPPLTLTVLPLPEFAQSRDAFTADDFTIDESWSQPLTDLVVGDSLTRSLTFTAKGAYGATIPPVFSSRLTGIKQYPDQPLIDDQSTDTGIIGSRKENTAFVLTDAGTYDIPSIQIYWVEAASGKVRTTAIPSTRITVSAAADDPSDDSAPATLSATEPVTSVNEATPQPKATLFQHPIWFWLSLILLTLWLATLYILWRGYHSKPSPKAATLATEATASALFENLLQNCRNNDPAATLMAFNQWGRTLQSTLRTNTEICVYLGDEAITKAVSRADKHYYDAHSTQAWHGAQLAEHLKQWQKHRPKDVGKNLPDLYP